jgi:Uma2 family endonuclease
LQKVEDYFEAGTQQVWVVYPEQRKVAVFHSLQASNWFAANDTLNGGALLPGFTCPVVELFE